MQKFVAAILVVASMTACEQEMNPPQRPNGVPDSAVWGGGADGGSWLDCTPADRPQSYMCSIYWDTDGSLWARGTYVLRQVTWSGDQQAAIYSEVESESEFTFQFFDGILIHLEGELALVPDGIIHYPFDNGRGKRQRYEVGIPQGDEEEY